MNMFEYAVARAWVQLRDKAEDKPLTKKESALDDLLSDCVLRYEIREMGQ